MPMRERVGGQLAKQCMQLPAGVGASRRRHPPGSRQGGPAVPTAFLVLLGAREGSSVARSVRCRGGHPSPGTPGRQQVAEPVSAEGLPATTTASASQGDTCTAQGGAGGSSTGSHARQQVAGRQGNAGQGGEGPEKTQIKTQGGEERQRRGKEGTQGREGPLRGHSSGGGGSAAGRFTTKVPEAGSKQMKGCPGGRVSRQEAGAQRRATKSVRSTQKRATAEREAVMCRGVGGGGPRLRAYMRRRPWSMAAMADRLTTSQTPLCTAAGARASQMLGLDSGAAGGS